MATNMSRATLHVSKNSVFSNPTGAFKPHKYLAVTCDYLKHIFALLDRFYVHLCPLHNSVNNILSDLKAPSGWGTHSLHFGITKCTLVALGLGKLFKNLPTTSPRPCAFLLFIQNAEREPSNDDNKIKQPKTGGSNIKQQNELIHLKNKLRCWFYIRLFNAFLSGFLNNF